MTALLLEFLMCLLGLVAVLQGNCSVEYQMVRS